MELVGLSDIHALGFRTGGRDVDLRARFALLNLTFDLRSAELRLGLFGHSQVASVVLSGVTHVYADPGQPDPRWTEIGDVGLMTRIDVFDVARVDDGRVPNGWWFSIATDDGLRVSVRATRLTFEQGCLAGAPGTSSTPVEATRWKRKRDLGWVLGAGSSRLVSDGARLELMELDLVNGALRLVVEAESARHLLELEAVDDLRIGPVSGAAAVAEMPLDGGAAPLVHLGPDGSGVSAGVEAWHRVETTGGLQVGVLARHVSMGRLPS
jgi:hypothetical protein